MTYYDQVTEAAEFLRGRLGGLRAARRHCSWLRAGSGGRCSVSGAVIVPYGEIPHFPQSTVEGHSGRIVAGLLGGVPVVVMQGRVHSYEGYTPQQVTFPMRVLGMLGIRAVVLTNAAGGIQEGYHVGQLVALADHINQMGWNPLTGPNEPRFAMRKGAGLRFFDMTEAYSKRLRALAKEAAREEGFALDEGVYLATPGPSFETPAEIRAFRALGATLVGMSTVPETIVARHMGIEVLGISVRDQPGGRAGRDAPEPRRGCRDGQAGGAAAGRAAGAVAGKIAAAVEAERMSARVESERRAGTEDHGCLFRRWCWGLRAARARARRHWRPSWRMRWAGFTFISTTTIATWGTCHSASESSRTSTIRR